MPGQSIVHASRTAAHHKTYQLLGWVPSTHTDNTTAEHSGHHDKQQQHHMCMQPGKRLLQPHACWHRCRSHTEQPQAGLLAAARGGGKQHRNTPVTSFSRALKYKGSRGLASPAAPTNTVHTPHSTLHAKLQSRDDTRRCGMNTNSMNRHPTSTGRCA